MVVCDVVDGTLGVIDPVTEEIKTLSQDEVALLHANHLKDVWFMAKDKKYLMKAIACSLNVKACEKWMANGNDGASFSALFERSDVVIYDVGRLGVTLTSDLNANLKMIMRAIEDHYYDIVDVVRFVKEQELELKWVEFEKEEIIDKADFVWK